MSVGFRAGIHKIGHSAQARIGRQRRRTKSAWMTIAVVASRFAHSLRPSQKNRVDPRAFAALSTSVHTTEITFTHLPSVSADNKHESTTAASRTPCQPSDTGLSPVDIQCKKLSTAFARGSF
jgi:hypothetical protein